MAKKQGCLAQSEYRLFQCINTIVDFGFIILYIINSIFLILGHIIVIGTTYTLVEYSDWLELARQQQNVVVLLLMGIFTLFVGIIGIVGANRLQHLLEYVKKEKILLKKEIIYPNTKLTPALLMIRRT